MDYHTENQEHQPNEMHDRGEDHGSHHAMMVADF